jgi:hypothetical protein
MKRHLWLVGVVLLCGALTAAPLPAPAADKPTIKSEQAPPGVEMAQALSTLTGVAISPLLGVGTVGAVKYFRTPVEKRASLSWFAQPWFWGPALLLVILVFLKDALGPSMPTVMKKPLDVAELFENKISALVAMGLFVPVVASIFHSVGDESQLSALGLATIDFVPLYNLLILPVALAAFLVVFLASHAINVLILISPFATVDAALKAFRLFLLSTVTATALLNPYVGAAWSVALIIISYFIAGWSLRMSVFGSVFAWDWLTLRWKRHQVHPESNWVFTARAIDKTPARTYGRLTRDDAGRMVLRYRPWLILPARSLSLPVGNYFVGRGLFYPEVHRAEGEDSQAQLILSPCYRTHEEAFRSAYGLRSVQDIGLRRGLKSLWRWLKSMVSSGPAKGRTEIPSAA